jgi:NADP-dependent aldehyde dehydrogenase
LVRVANEETHLSESRLQAEIVRTAFQLTLVAKRAEQGADFPKSIDVEDPSWPMGPRPDLRRSAVPVGPVVVFAASNFPFAFSVAGGDTASALAAGCPVVLTANPGHPRLSALTTDVILDTLRAHHVESGVFATIFGREAGVAAVSDPRIKAGAFTGSTAGGRALFDIAVSRDDPIPFYAEMGSINPTFVTPSAASAREVEIAVGFIDSFTLSQGQLCTKPGVFVMPAGSPLIERLRLIELPVGGPLLNDQIHLGYSNSLQRLANQHGVQIVRAGDDVTAGGVSPTILSLHGSAFLQNPELYAIECFGPAALVLTYESHSEMLDIAHSFTGQLTATIHGEDDDPFVSDLISILRERAGRLIWNQWPTGVSVTDAQHHGGPYPATTVPTSTSVGTSAIQRFLRPITYQGFPPHLLPEELRN